jgi:hypothetical protein
VAKSAGVGLAGQTSAIGRRAGAFFKLDQATGTTIGIDIRFF